jgi:hypothetical protein
MEQIFVFTKSSKARVFVNVAFTSISALHVAVCNNRIAAAIEVNLAADVTPKNAVGDGWVAAFCIVDPTSDCS